MDVANVAIFSAVTFLAGVALGFYVGGEMRRVSAHDSIAQYFKSRGRK